MSAFPLSSSSRPSCSSSHYYRDDHPPTHQLTRLEFFRMSLPKSICEHSPPVLSDEELKNRFLREHTTYPIACTKHRSTRGIQQLFVEAQIYLHLYNGTPQVFSPSHIQFASQYCLAAWNEDNKISCQLWSPDNKSPTHTLRDVATESTFTLQYTPPDLTSDLFFSDLMDHNALWNKIRRHELGKVTKSLSETPEKVTWIPIQQIPNSNSYFKLFCRAKITEKGFTAQFGDSNPEWKPHPWITPLARSILHDGPNDALESMIQNPKFVSFLKDRTTYSGAHHWIIESANSPIKLKDDALREMYLLSAIILECHKGRPHNLRSETKHGNVNLIAFIDDEGKEELLWWSGILNRKQAEKSNLWIGKGAFSIAQSAIKLSTGKNVVLKYLHKKHTRNLDWRLLSIYREEFVLKMLRAAFGKIVGLPSPPLFVIPPNYLTEQKSYLVGGRVEKYYGINVKRLAREEMRPQQRLSLFRSFIKIMELVNFLNNLQYPLKNIFHGDITENNILGSIKNDKVKLKLIDFGLVKTLDDMMQLDYKLYIDEYRCLDDDPIVHKMRSTHDHEGMAMIMKAREVFALGHTLLAMLNIDTISVLTVTAENLTDLANDHQLFKHFYVNTFQLAKKMTMNSCWARKTLPSAIEELSVICDTEEIRQKSIFEGVSV